jgi:Xaa-Pro aminopeptidase
MLGRWNLSIVMIARAGPHLCFVHVSKNSGLVGRGDLDLFDCGLFFGHYTGEITRTFSTSEKFSPDQAAVSSAEGGHQRARSGL